MHAAAQMWQLLFAEVIASDFRVKQTRALANAHYLLAVVQIALAVFATMLGMNRYLTLTLVFSVYPLMFLVYEVNTRRAKREAKVKHEMWEQLGLFSIDPPQSSNT